MKRKNFLAEDFIVRVDRSVKPNYPDLIKSLMHPELEEAGPNEYNLEYEVEPWLHHSQTFGSEPISGNDIYEWLQNKNDIFISCLSLQDGLAIQKMGIGVFNYFFKGKSIALWPSVGQDNKGIKYVPCLTTINSKVKVELFLNWVCLDEDWSSDNIALRVNKKDHQNRASWSY